MANSHSGSRRADCAAEGAGRAGYARRAAADADAPACGHRGRAARREGAGRRRTVARPPGAAASVARSPDDRHGARALPRGRRHPDRIADPQPGLRVLGVQPVDRGQRVPEVVGDAEQVVPGPDHVDVAVLAVRARLQELVAGARGRRRRRGRRAVGVGDGVGLGVGVGDGVGDGVGLGVAVGVGLGDGDGAGDGDGSTATLAGTSVGTGASEASGTSGVGVATAAIAVGDSPTTGMAMPPRCTTKANDSAALSTRISRAATVAFGMSGMLRARRRGGVRGPAEVAGAVGVGVAKADQLLLAEGLRPRCTDRDARLLGARDARRGHEGPVQVAAQERAHRRVQGARDVVRPEHDRTGRDGVGVLRDVQGVGREGSALRGVGGGVAGGRQGVIAGARRTGIRHGATLGGFFAQLEFLPVEIGTSPRSGRV